MNATLLLAVFEDRFDILQNADLDQGKALKQEYIIFPYRSMMEDIILLIQDSGVDKFPGDWS